MPTDADIRAVLDRAGHRLGPGDRVSVFPDRPEDAEASLTADGWCEEALANEMGITHSASRVDVEVVVVGEG